MPKSIKNTDTVKNKGYDAGKVFGIKRIWQLIPTACLYYVCYYICDVTDRNGAIKMLRKYNDNLSQAQNILVDTLGT